MHCVILEYAYATLNLALASLLEGIVANHELVALVGGEGFGAADIKHAEAFIEGGAVPADHHRALRLELI